MLMKVEKEFFLYLGICFFLFGKKFIWFIFWFILKFEILEVEMSREVSGFKVKWWL